MLFACTQPVCTVRNQVGYQLSMCGKSMMQVPVQRLCLEHASALCVFLVVVYIIVLSDMTIRPS